MGKSPESGKNETGGNYEMKPDEKPDTRKALGELAVKNASKDER